MWRGGRWKRVKRWAQGEEVERLEGGVFGRGVKRGMGVGFGQGCPVGERFGDGEVDGVATRALCSLGFRLGNIP